MKSPWILCAFAASTIVLTLSGDAPKTDDKGIAFYNEKILPIFKKECYRCHGDKEKEVKGEFWVASRENILEGGETGPSVDLRNPEKSLLLKYINHTDDDHKMPPKKKLSDDKIKLITEWVKMGVPMPKSDYVYKPEDLITDENKKFWAFQPVTAKALPTVKNKAWTRNSIDHFILSKLEKAELSPAADADKISLIRRATYDLTGLPPSQKEISDFVNDHSQEAFAKVVDRLLASPHYGEKWARHWLDLVRYADTRGYERDAPIPETWRYREYVVNALNKDKPYNQFVHEQLAGDELENVTKESLIATGYYHLAVRDDEPSDAKQAHFDYLDDVVRVTSEVFLGFTVACARCHDHKIDPVPQEDYYSMLAFFRNVNVLTNREHPIHYFASLKEQEACDKLNKDRREALRKEIKKIEEGFTATHQKKFPNAKVIHDNLIRDILKNRYKELYTQEEVKNYKRLLEKLRKLKDQRAGIPILSVREGKHDYPATHLFVRGNVHAPSAIVEPAFPQILTKEKPQIKEVNNRHGKSSGLRTAFAKWITSEDNPLTARVMVNRVWQHHFGRGLVRSSSNFGFGDKVKKHNKATHPDLLDNLTYQFVNDDKWSLKALHRRIMLSRTYQMSSKANPKALGQDPINDLFWRFNMRRLTAEEIRDSVLNISGTLDLTVGGPYVHPTLSEEVLASQSRNKWKTNNNVDNRRSLYSFVMRSLNDPQISQFDGPDTDASCDVRFSTNQPTQVLMTLNSKFYNDAAKLLRKRIQKEKTTLKDQVILALTLATAREPNKAKIDIGLKFINDYSSKYNVSQDKALTQFCLIVLNLNEFIYLN